MSPRLNYSYRPGELAKAFVDKKNPIANAATEAMSDAANIAKAAGRASIAAAGFSSKWQNALRADVYPKGGIVSMSPAALIHHRIAYSGEFERGGTIRGQPFLWLPIEANLPRRSGGRKWTPKDFVRQFGALTSVNRPGKPPLLVARVRQGSRRVALPVFVGVPLVEIGKKFDVTGAVQKAADQLPALYSKHLKTD